jgi:hypothetical protein
LTSPDTVVGVVDRRRDVVVAPQEVGRVVARLDHREAVPGRPRVGVARSRLAHVAEEVDLGSGVPLLRGSGEAGSPGLADGLVLGSLVGRGDIGHGPSPAMREGGGLDGVTVAMKETSTFGVVAVVRSCWA